MQNLRIVFLGTPDFAVASLDILLKNGYNIVGVVTAPDKPAGRGQKLHESDVKQYAVTNGLNVLQPTNLKSREFIEELRSLKADLQIVVAFRMLPEAVWNMPSLGTFNLHGSLLPQYRGAAPIHWAVINGEKETGVTTFLLKHEIDTGRIMFNERTPIGENDTTGEVYDRLMNIGAHLTLKTVKSIEADNYPQIEQESLIAGELKHAPKIFKEDCLIDWKQPIDIIHNKIRGLSPFPTAFTNLVLPNGEVLSLKVFKTLKEIVTHQHNVPTLLGDGKSYLKVAVNGGVLNLIDVQLAGKKRMPIDELLRGFKTDGVKISV